MDQQEIDLLRYPIGKFLNPKIFSKEIASQNIEIIDHFPSLLTSEVHELSARELKFRYRPDGWTIAQVVHHAADSHMNAFVRFKLALTETTPTIKPYMENLWAQLPDVDAAPPDASLKILEGLHVRWCTLLRSLSEKDFERKYSHPAQKREIMLSEVLGLYAWHCSHHLAHVQQAKKFGEKF
jgi:hypothetical protein